ncbi:Protein of unknown function [Gryllus bimaculatus]|nr:Protein of unknown function [Gryllus bimaculatus]
MRGRGAVLLLAVGVALLAAREAGGAIARGRRARANPRESDEDASSEDGALGPAEDGLAAWAASLDAQAKRREQDEREERERLARHGAAARALAPSTARTLATVPQAQQHTVPPPPAHATQPQEHHPLGWRRQCHQRLQTRHHKSEGSDQQQFFCKLPSSWCNFK